MSTRKQLERLILGITRDDDSWPENIDFQIETKLSAYDAGLQSGNEKGDGEAEFRWFLEDILVTASIGGWDEDSSDDWFATISIENRSDRVSKEFHSKSSIITGLETALSDPEAFFGPFSSRLLDELQRLNPGRLGIEPASSRPVSVVYLAKKVGARAVLGETKFLQDTWNLTLMGRQFPVGDDWKEEGGLIDQVTLSLKDEESLIDAVERWAADPRVFF